MQINITAGSNSFETAVGEMGDRVFLDISDLIQYWHDNTRPTGIQRVQIETIRAQGGGPSAQDGTARRAGCIFYSVPHRNWMLVDQGRLLRQIDRSYAEKPDWDSWKADLAGMLEAAAPYSPENRDAIINIGSSWWIPDYLYKIRSMKQEWGIRYVPFVHDAIPLVTPQYCARELVSEFLLWFRDAIRTADHIIVNSECSKRDVQRLAMVSRGSCPDITVCTLNAKFGTAPTAHKSQVTKHLGIYRQRFVLCVGTLEVRKNHLLLFRVWSRLLETLPERQVPALVLVGKNGWKFDFSRAFLGSNPALERKVLMAHNLSDGDLGALYDECLFTVYPSFYEGWGLPLTEAASHRKLTVSSNTSSLPEAASAGDILIDPKDEEAWFRQILALVTDEGELSRAEERSIQGARFRSWSDIADTIYRSAQLGETRAQPDPRPKVVDGTIYDFSSVTAKEQYQNSGMALRQGDGWYHLETWGIWTAPGVAELAFDVADRDLRYIYLVIEGGRQDKTLQIFMDEAKIIDTRLIDGKRAIVRLEVDSSGGVSHVIRFFVDRYCDFGKVTNGADAREVGFGLVKFACMQAANIAARQNFMESLSMQFSSRPA